MTQSQEEPARPAGRRSSWSLWQWPYRSRLELQRSSPSVRDGMSAEREEDKRYAYANLVQDVGTQLKIPQTVIATATILCHRFYASRSMCKNNTMVIAAACLFTSAKIGEYPKALQNVLKGVWQCKFKGQLDRLSEMSDKDLWDAFKTVVLKAERVLLYEMGFHFNVILPYEKTLAYVRDLMGKGGLAVDSAQGPSQALSQTAWNFVSVSLRTTLCLQHPPELIAAGAVFAALKLHRVKPGPSLSDPREWFQQGPVNADAAALEDVTLQLLEAVQKMHRFHRCRAAPPLLANELSVSAAGGVYAALEAQVQALQAPLAFNVESDRSGAAAAST